MSKQGQASAALVIVAMVWGAGFIPQKLAMEYMGAHAFNALRFSFAVVVLLPLLIWRRTGGDKKIPLKAGVLLGVILFFGAALQQMSLVHTTVAKVAFLTSLYVAFIPLLGLLLGHRYRSLTWLGAVLTVLGLYYLTGFTAGGSAFGDTLALAGAVCWAVHLLLTSYSVEHHSRLMLAALQFAVCAGLSALSALIFEQNQMVSLLAGLHWPVINGVIVVGISYTAHIIMLRYVRPFVAGIILSLEAVFGALAGYWAFGESWTVLGGVGAALILCGCILAQLPEKPVVSNISVN